MQLQGDKENTDICGTYVVSDQPIGIVSGNRYTYVETPVARRKKRKANGPDIQNPANHLEVMVAPTSSWGQQHVITPIRGLTMRGIIRVLGKYNK